VTQEVDSSTQAVLLSCNDLGQVVHTRATVIEQYSWVPVRGRDALQLGR